MYLDLDEKTNCYVNNNWLYMDENLTIRYV